jgi:glycosyltransferase involved in cell wall biosynthesis
MKARTALVCNSSWAMVNFRLPVLLAMRDAGRRPVVIAPDDGGVELLGREGIEFVPWKLEGRGTNPLSELFAIIGLFRALARLKPGLVIDYTIKPAMYGSLLSPLLGFHAIAVVTGLGLVFIEKGAKGALIKGLYGFALRFSRSIWFLNEDDRRLFLKEGLGRPGAGAVMPGEGVDAAWFAPRSPGPDSPARRGPVFLMLSRLLRDKGIREYLEAAREVKKDFPGAVFRLAGVLDEKASAALSRQELEASVSEGSVEYLGMLPDVREAIAESDFVVLPSYREGLPRCLLEAASMGKPLVATDVAGCRELVREGWNGFLAEARSAESLRLALLKACALGTEDARAMGSRGRELVLKKYEMRKVLDFYARALADI